MSSQLRWTLSPDSSTVVLEGTLDEYANLVGLGAALSTPTVYLDLGGVRRINSLGVRQWIELMRSLGGKPIILRRCPPVMVEQLCALQDFRGHSRVESVLLPYTCELCATRVLVEFPLAGAHALPESPACAQCGQPSTFDDFPERYLGLGGAS